MISDYLIWVKLKKHVSLDLGIAINGKFRYAEKTNPDL